MLLYIFDKDGTLVSGAIARPTNTPEEQVLLPNVKRIICKLRKRGDKIAIASNQGGVAWGFITYEQADELLKDCAKKIGGVDAYEFCPHDDRKNEPCECRKPKPGMILKIAERLGFGVVDDIVFVGDQDSDEQAARAAGVAFVRADVFFDPKGWGYKPRKHNPEWKDNTRTKRSDKRKGELQAAAERDGFETWSEAITAWKNGEAVLVRK